MKKILFTAVLVFIAARASAEDMQIYACKDINGKIEYKNTGGVKGCKLVNLEGIQYTQPTDFVSEFIYGIGALNRRKRAAELDLKGKNETQILMSMLFYLEAIKSDIAEHMATVKNMMLPKPNEDLIGLLTKTYQEDADIYSDMYLVSSQFATSKPDKNVDYVKLSAEMPRLRVKLENIEKNFLRLSLMVFSVLIDFDGDNSKPIRLKISSKQKESLLRIINNEFGAINPKNPTNMENAAWVLREQLLKKFPTKE